MYYEESKKTFSKQQWQLPDRASDQEIALRLGIENFREKFKSYSKTLNNNSSFAYDNEGIYLIDKLEITFSSNEYYLFDEKDDLLRFENIVLKKERGVEKHFTDQYKIIIDDSVFGFLNFHSTSESSFHKIEVSNETLYVRSRNFILNTLYTIAKHFSFSYANICKYELARDSQNDYYDQFAWIYYQSTFCGSQNHKAHNSKPIYSFYGKCKNVVHEVDSKNQDFGTAIIGSRDSDTRVKLYTKSHELKKWKEEKNYINEIHHKYFQEASKICRVEVIANSKAFVKRDLDLLELLLHQNHPRIFQSLLGDKLKFKDLKTKFWDGNKNKKFKFFQLIDPNFYNTYTIEFIRVKKNTTTHNNRKDKFQDDVQGFLDDERGIDVILDLFKRNIWKKPISIKKYHLKLQRAINNYRGIIDLEKQIKIKLIHKLLDNDGGRFAKYKYKIWFWLRRQLS